MDWAKAKQHFDQVRQIYQDLQGLNGVNTTLALRIVFDPLGRRYNRGERTKELYGRMMAVE